jgi:hypothetical protein
LQIPWAPALFHDRRGITDQIIDIEEIAVLQGDQAEYAGARRALLLTVPNWVKATTRPWAERPKSSSRIGHGKGGRDHALCPGVAKFQSALPLESLLAQ